MLNSITVCVREVGSLLSLSSFHVSVCVHTKLHNSCCDNRLFEKSHQCGLSDFPFSLIEHRSHLMFNNSPLRKTPGGKSHGWKAFVLEGRSFHSLEGQKLLDVLGVSHSFIHLCTCVSVCAHVNMLDVAQKRHKEQRVHIKSTKIFLPRRRCACTYITATLRLQTASSSLRSKPDAWGKKRNAMHLLSSRNNSVRASEHVTIDHPLCLSHSALMTRWHQHIHGL